MQVRNIFFWCLLVSNYCVFSQTKIKASYYFNNNNAAKIATQLKLPTQFNDSIEVQQMANQILLFCMQKSYILTEVNPSFATKDSVHFIIILNQSFKWLKLKNPPFDYNLLSAAGFNSTDFNNQTFSPEFYTQKVKNALNWLQNNSFPFASFSLDSVIIDSTTITANIKFSKGPQIIFDSIKVIGNAKISPTFLANYTNIKFGKYYNENILKRTDNRLSELPYLTLNQSSVVYFYGNKAKLITYLSNKKASSFDGIIGFAPNSSKANKLIITGDLNLKLQNILGSGKALELNYRSFLNNSQELKFKFNYPYLFNSKIALDYALNLLLYDTSFFDLQNDFAFQYRLIGTNYLKVFYSTQNTSLITVDTNFIKTNKTLPNINDVKKDFYGVGLKFTKIDYLPNPNKGYILEMDLAIGTKSITKNATINAIQLQGQNGENYKLYDSIKLNYTQYKATIKFENYYKIKQNLVVKTEVNAAWFQTESLFLNELFRIGGLKTLRGFDEQSIFANKFAITNAELRYLLGKNSNVFAFYNQAWYVNEVTKNRISDNPFGFGAGLVFESSAGLFTLVYAVGKQFQNPIEFNSAKIHFGYINYF
jgi:outer membrane translocation and assembly module TamA